MMAGVYMETESASVESLVYQACLADGVCTQ